MYGRLNKDQTIHCSLLSKKNQFNIVFYNKIYTIKNVSY